MQKEFQHWRYILERLIPIVNKDSSRLPYYVDGSVSSSGDGLSTYRPFKTIQEAVNAAVLNTNRSFGDRIIITPATYAENVVIPDGLHNLALEAAVAHGNSKRVSIAPASGIGLHVKAVTRFRGIGLRCVGTSEVGCKMEGEGGLFEDCDFYSDTTHGFVFDSSKTVADFTGSGVVIRGGVIRECGGAGLRSIASEDVAEINYGLQATNVIIDGVQFYLNTGDDIDDDAAAANPTYFYQWEIVRCKFMTKDKTTYLDMNGSTAAGNECLIHDNDFASATLDGTKIQKPAISMFINNRSKTGIETAL